MLVVMLFVLFFFFFKQKTAYELRISDWSSDVCSSDLGRLACLAGHQALLQNCNRYGRQLVAASRRLPADFAPAIVLDASGRVRHTYRVWEQHGDDLIRLPEAANDYANLAVHHWNRAANKEVLADPAARQSVLQTIADVINASPSDERSEEHTSELQSLMRISYAVFCLKKKKPKYT